MLLGNKKAKEAQNWFETQIAPYMGGSSKKHTTQPHTLYLIHIGVTSLAELDKCIKSDAVGRAYDASRAKKILRDLVAGGFITATLDIEYADEWHSYELTVSKKQLADYKRFVKETTRNFIAKRDAA